MAKRISQDTFDEVVKENMEDFDMPLEEALKDAIEQFEAQGVDLSAIVKTGVVGDHPVVSAIKTLKSGTADAETVAAALKTLKSECDANRENGAIASTHAAVATVVDVCSPLSTQPEELQVLCMNALSALCNKNTLNQDGLSNTAIAEICSVLENAAGTDSAAPATASAVAGALLISRSCRRNENNRIRYVNGSVVKFLLDVLRRAVAHKDSALARTACTAARVLTFDDDMRADFGNAHEHAKQLFEAGGTTQFLDMFRAGLDAAATTSACSTLARVIVKDEYCADMVAANGLQLLIASMETHLGDKALITQACLLLKTLAGNDECKELICTGPCLPLVIRAMGIHIEEPGVQEYGCAVLTAVELRSPSNCGKVIAAGGADTITSAMRSHPTVPRVQRQACMAIRNCVVRSAEHIPKFLELGAEALLREAMETLGADKVNGVGDAAHAALRDLNVDGVEFKEAWKGIKNPMQGAKKYEPGGAILKDEFK